MNNMPKGQNYIKTPNGKEFPIADIRPQGGLKKKIVELVNNLPEPDRECELTDFLGALQYVLDDHKNRVVDIVEQLENMREALELATAVIQTEEVLADFDTCNMVPMINQIAEEGIESLGGADREFYIKHTQL